MKKEEKSRSLVKHKLFLIFTKFLSHLLGLGYIIYTLLGFYDIDAVEISYMVHLSIIPWLYAYSASKALEFCYIHRLPLYYILIDELLLIIDYYYTIPLEVYDLFILHLSIIALLIFVYTYYYVRYYKRNTKIVNK